MIVQDFVLPVVLFLSSFSLGMIIAPTMIEKIKILQVGGQPIRIDGPEMHLMKKGTPTAGGVIVFFAWLIPVAIMVMNSGISTALAITVLCTICYGAIGLADDLRKLKKRNHAGLSAKTKMVLQLMIAIVPAIYSINVNSGSILLMFGVKVHLWQWVYLIFALVFISGFTNAVNLTDGLDGLVSIPIVSSLIVLAIVISAKGDVITASVCLSLAGAVTSFLWFNINPARIFMGDTGSMLCGGFLSTVSVIYGVEFFFAVSGLLFFTEALSVMIQVLYYKKTGKRFFLMAPIHHHFEQKNVKETTIVMKCWLLSIISSFLAVFFWCVA